MVQHPALGASDPALHFEGVDGLDHDADRPFGVGQGLVEVVGAERVPRQVEQVDDAAPDRERQLRELEHLDLQRERGFLGEVELKGLVPQGGVVRPDRPRVLRLLRDGHSGKQVPREVLRAAARLHVFGPENDDLHPGTPAGVPVPLGGAPALSFQAIPVCAHAYGRFRGPIVEAGGALPAPAQGGLPPIIRPAAFTTRPRAHFLPPLLAPVVTLPAQFFGQAVAPARARAAPLARLPAQLLRYAVPPARARAALPALPPPVGARAAPPAHLLLPVLPPRTAAARAARLLGPAIAAGAHRPLPVAPLLAPVVPLTAQAKGLPGARAHVGHWAPPMVVGLA
mmetsp:Transcript_47839/g.77862  ORF Transcript_47839/g.77862 Transcript_47839/m.77862 type:complete len:340 (-) Transcript_47839:154-1173(-)